jgi:hypothetical protein
MAGQRVNLKEKFMVLDSQTILDQKSFVKFLASLAPKGETLLLVRQKPRLRNRQVELHADGAVKATWPAMLPTADIKPGWAIYANTASFILDRMPENVSASASNCEFILVMMLDDIGTKSKEPPLKPTWVMETSPGSFQWGYAFSDQPSKGEFSAAIRAIADAGYTDPGACNPVRNFRIPGSVNLKPGRDNFAARLVSFDPTVDYTLPEICTALGVVPHEADTSAHRPVSLKDDGGDDVSKWLSDNGLVIVPVNSAGWMGIVCPNAAEHTDGNPEGRYNPTMRSFCCLHSHCIDLDSDVFLQWVAEQGGPEHAPGLRGDLLVKAYSQAISKLTPTEDFPNVSVEVVESAERRQASRETKDGWFERYAYVVKDDCYFDLLTRQELSRGSFNALYRHVGCKSIHNDRKVEASVAFDELRESRGAAVVREVTYAAGDPVLTARDGDLYANRWSDARPSLKGDGGVSDTDVGKWLSHCARLLPDPAELKHVLDVMAFKLQNPGVKINHAILHGGTQGCGKDTMWHPFIWSVCGPYLKNRGLIDNDSLHSQWGYQLEAEIVLLNELKEPEAKERRALANRLKPIIAAPPTMIPINRKGLHPYSMMNRMLVMAFTNDPAPISIDSQDRRWFCIWSESPRLTPEEGKDIWDWFNAGGVERVALWLHQRDVSAFNPGAAPMWTEFKYLMIEQGRSIAESFLVDMIKQRKNVFASGVIASPFYALCDKLAGSAPSGVKIVPAALVHALAEAGWRDLGRVKSRELLAKKQLFCAPDMVEKYTRSELRNMVEDDPIESKVINIHRQK